MKKIKYFITIGVILTIFTSCDNKNSTITTSPYSKRFLVTTTNNENWTCSTVQCDSLKMESLTHIKTYSDGIMSNIYAKRITVKSNPWYKQVKTK